MFTSIPCCLENVAFIVVLLCEIPLHIDNSTSPRSSQLVDLIISPNFVSIAFSF